MTDITILIDQSYFIQNNPETKSVEERTQEFMEKFLEAKNKSLMLGIIPTEDKNEILPKFLFESLYLNTSDPNEFPTANKLDNFILNYIKKDLDIREEEVAGAVDQEERVQELPQGPEEVEDSLEEGERGEEEEGFESTTINSGNGGNDGEDGDDDDENKRSPAEIEEGNTRRLDSSVEIQDGESITIRRDPSGPVNRFF